MKATYETKPDQFNVFVRMSDFELKTREIMSEVWELADLFNYEESSTRRALARAFVANYSLSETAERWIAVAEALLHCPIDPVVGQKVLTAMSRKGYLRSRRSSFGLTLYEVNY